MTRPLLELADIVRAAGQRLIDRHPAWLTWAHVKVLVAIEGCRTAALGGHVDECSRCGHRAISYNSCRNRHCPKCQNNVRDRWLNARRSELLAAPYSHVVFTLPHELAPLALQNKEVIYSLLFRFSAETVIQIARDPKHLGAEIGFFSVLHTWNQKLQHHPHVHCVVAAGGLSPDRTQWVRPRCNSCFVPEAVLSKVFRGKFVEALKRTFAAGKLQFHGQLQAMAQPKVFRSFLRQLFCHRWVVYCKPPFGGPDQVLHYLGAYTHRVAISDHRLVSFVDDQVTFRWRDSAHRNKKRLMTLPADEFLRRFLLHVLPRGFVRIRHYGFLSNRCRRELVPLCKQLLAAVAPTPTPTGVPSPAESISMWICPLCGGPMIVRERLTADQIALRSPPQAKTA
jgi:predicted RNA-binding Zn-ribbon protein involved in translation (DUF1610 family)